MARDGVREVTLLGQNVNSTGATSAGQRTSFAELLGMIDAIEGIERIRYTTRLLHEPHAAPLHLGLKLDQPAGPGPSLLARGAGARAGRRRAATAPPPQAAARAGLALLALAVLGELLAALGGAGVGQRGRGLEADAVDARAVVVAVVRVVDGDLVLVPGQAGPAAGRRRRPAPAPPCCQ